MKRKYIFLILTTIFFSQYTMFIAQVVYEPTHKSVYVFLDKMAGKGMISQDDLVLPLSRKDILYNLKVIDNGLRFKNYYLSDIEKQELTFYLQDYYLESNLLNEFESMISKNNDSLSWNNFVTDPIGRNRLFYFNNEKFKLNIDPIYGLKYGSKNGEKYSHWWNGFSTFGYLDNWLGFSFDFRDNHESGINADRVKDFVSEKGITEVNSDEESFDYSEFNANIGINGSWGSLSVGKGNVEWGYGGNGKLVLSSKSPSYPYIRFELKPTNWLNFYYLHGWLASDVLDTVSSYATNRENYNRTIFREKYIASHTIQVNFYKNTSFSFGESIVYSDKLEFLYLFPLSFFRAADHYLSKNNNDAGANSQFFFNLSSKNIIPNTHLWAEYLIDEITLDELGNSTTERTQHAYALGFSNYDSFIENLTIKASYTKIYPFVYRHYIPTQTYESRGYLLGHWIGHNSDQIYSELNYTFLRGAKLNLWGEYIRKGENGVVDDQYVVPQLPFLFGKIKYYFDWGVSLKYEITHDAGFILKYYKRNIENENNTTKEDEFTFSAYFGM